jgi:Flp pilus assembly pilin Flp
MQDAPFLPRARDGIEARVVSFPYSDSLVSIPLLICELRQECVAARHAVCLAPARPGVTDKEKTKMNRVLLKLLVNLQCLTSCEEGQDLVEYALLCTMISLVLISAMSGISNSVNKVFANISSSLA